MSDLVDDLDRAFDLFRLRSISIVVDQDGRFQVNMNERGSNAYTVQVHPELGRALGDCVKHYCASHRPSSPANQLRRQTARRREIEDLI